MAAPLAHGYARHIDARCEDCAWRREAYAEGNGGEALAALAAARRHARTTGHTVAAEDSITHVYRPAPEAQPRAS